MKKATQQLKRDCTPISLLQTNRRQGDFFVPTVEVRLQFCPPLPWEEIRPVQHTLEDEKKLMQLLNCMAAQPGVRQLRWNWAGSSQGHYMEGPAYQTERRTS